MATPQSIAALQQAVVTEAEAVGTIPAVVTKAQVALTEAQAFASEPSWLPAPGTAVAVGLNTIKDVDPCPARNCPYSIGTLGIAGLFSYSGGVFVPSLGAYGSVLTLGGGHDDYLGNELYRYDVETRRFTRLSEPYSALVTGPNGFRSDQASCEFFSTTSGDVPGNSGPSQPYPNHTYASLVWVPGPDAGNVNGFVFKGYQQWRVQAWGRQIHWFDLDKNQWARVGNAPQTGSFLNAPSVYDSNRKRLIRLSNGGPFRPFEMPLATKVWAPFGIDSAIWAYDGNLHYSPGKDRLLLTDGGNALKIYDPMVSSLPAVPLLLGNAPPTIVGGCEWVESKQAMYFWPSVGSTLYCLRPTSDDWSKPWQRTSQTFAGSIPPNQYPNRHYSRFRYVTALDVFVWIGQVGVPAWAFRVTI